MERPGGVADWGLVFNQNGQVVAGMGGPDRGFASALTPTPGLADGQPHVATFVHTGNQIRLFVDTHFHGRLVGVATSAREDQPFSFGSAQTFGDGGAHFTGDIAEILLDNTGVTDEDVVALQNNLVTTYGITIPPPPPPPPLPPSGLRGWWTADDLLDDNGSPVSTWTDRVAMRQANAPVDVARRPTLVTDSLNFNGHNAIAFNGAEQDQLRVAGANSPMAGNESFTISVVFRTENAGVGAAGSQWWSNTGIVDAEQPGGTADWGLAFNSAGQIAGGIGGPDVTVNSAGGLNDGDAHIAIFRHDSLSGEVFVTVDGVTTMGSGAALSTARNVADMVFGAIQTNEADRHFTGEIADIRIQADFLSDAATMALYDELFGTYIIPEPGTLFSAMIALAIGAAVWRRRRVAGS
jgi:hypothetical protein